MGAWPLGMGSEERQCGGCVLGGRAERGQLYQLEKVLPVVLRHEAEES